LKGSHKSHLGGKLRYVPLGLYQQFLVRAEFVHGREVRRDHNVAHTETLVEGDRKSTRLNSSHRTISYAVFCLKKKKKTNKKQKSRNLNQHETNQPRTTPHTSDLVPQVRTLPHPQPLTYVNATELPPVSPRRTQ